MNRPNRYHWVGCWAMAASSARVSLAIVGTTTKAASRKRGARPRLTPPHTRRKRGPSEKTDAGVVLGSTRDDGTLMVATSLLVWRAGLAGREAGGGAPSRA